MPGGHFFLSHSGADSLAAADLVIAMRARGLGVWFDKDSLPPGELWQQAIEEAIANASGMLVYVGANGVEKWVDREVRAGLVRNTATPATFPLIPLIAQGGSVDSLPPFLSQHQAVDVRTPDGIERLLTALERKDGIAIDAAYWRDHSPFRGLQTFEPRDAWLFFGRDQETKDLLDRMNQAPVVAVLGNSGSGKSSLVRAGLIPALRRGRYQSRGVWVPDWRIAVFRPTSEPFQELAERLLAEFAKPDMTVEAFDQVRASVNAGHVRDALLRLVGTGRVLLVADQFEEVFTQVADSDLRHRYTDALLDAARTEGDLPVHVVLAMRADFYPHCLDHTRLKGAIEANLYGVSLMPRDKLREAVMSRLALAGRNSGDGLVDLLLEDVGDEPGNLALLEHALDQLWSKKLSVDEYTKQRQLAGVLARHADTVYGDFKEEQDRKLVEKIFIDLVQTAEGSPDTRRRVPKSLLLHLDEPARVESVLDRMATGRLITISGGVGGDAVVEVSHETLIRDWPALRGWVDRDRADIQMQRDLEVEAARWRANPREKGLLVRRARLATAAEWLERHPQAPAPVSEFLKVSRKEEQRELRVWRLVVAALVLLSLGVSVAAWYARGQQLVAESRELAAEATKRMPLDRPGAFAMALRAWERAQSVEALDAVIHTFLRATYMKGHSDFVNSAFFSPDGLRVVTASSDQTARVWDAASGKMLTELQGHSELVISATFSADGLRVVTASGDRTARVWDAANGRALVELRGHSLPVLRAEFSPNGQRVVTASGDKTARVWDAASGKILAELKGHSGWVSSAAFSPDGLRVVTASRDQTACIWDAASGQTLAQLKGHSSQVLAAAFSPDGGGW